MSAYLALAAGGGFMLALWMTYRAGVRAGAARERTRWLRARETTAQRVMTAFKEMQDERTRTEADVRDALDGAGDLARARRELSDFAAGPGADNSDAA